MVIAAVLAKVPDFGLRWEHSKANVPLCNAGKKIKNSAFPNEAWVVECVFRGFTFGALCPLLKLPTFMKYGVQQVTKRVIDRER